jgi:hypothetical protein
MMLANVQQATIKPNIEAGVAKGALIHADEYDIYGGLPRMGTRTEDRLPRTATAFMKSMSIRWRASGRCCVHGCDLITASPKKSCRSISRFSSSCKTPKNME